jgi:hypothetical protein
VSCQATENFFVFDFIIDIIINKFKIKHIIAYINFIKRGKSVIPKKPLHEKNGYRLDQRDLRIDKTTNQPSNSKKTFGENSYYKNKKKNNDNDKKENDENDLAKAKKTGKIINTGSKSQKIENSDSDSDDE